MAPEVAAHWHADKAGLNWYQCAQQILTLHCLMWQVLDLSGGALEERASGREARLGHVKISTSCVRGNLVAAGGFNGELAVANLEAGPGVAFRSVLFVNCFPISLLASQCIQGKICVCPPRRYGLACLLLLNMQMQRREGLYAT